MGLFNTRKTILTGFILSVLMIFFFAFYANRDMKRVRKESAEAENIILSLSTLEAILDDMQDIETSQRGYLLSGDTIYLNPYEEGSRRLQHDTARLKSLEAKFPEKSASFEDLLYRGPAALHRILELQAEVEGAVPREQRAARESLDELFDLVRLAMS
jgi:CHASE3 domain sensor protein